jgi:hypothetical protein
VLDPRVVRALVLAILLVAGCDYAAENAAVDDRDGDDAAGAGECVTADDCTLAQTTCCGCDDYGVPSWDAGNEGCDLVECPEPAPSGCPSVVPACVDGACTLACAPTTCELSCTGGFATDAAGCLTCDCAQEPAAPECAGDADCVRVPADCCGCAGGGSDTAVPASEAEDFGASLECPPDPACPDIDVCDADLVARCAGGQCVLDGGAPPGDRPPPCGSPELPPCPEGTVCVLNAETDSSMDGLGVCQPP